MSRIKIAEAFAILGGLILRLCAATGEIAVRRRIGKIGTLVESFGKSVGEAD